LNARYLNPFPLKPQSQQGVASSRDDTAFVNNQAERFDANVPQVRLKSRGLKPKLSGRVIRITLRRRRHRGQGFVLIRSGATATTSVASVAWKRPFTMRTGARLFFRPVLGCFAGDGHGNRD
jgi:hypothetical protein